MVWMIGSDEESAALEELSSASDRAAAILAAVIVENRLTDALKKFLHDDTKVANEMFRSSGPVGVFSAKIDLAFLVGLCSADARRELVTVKDIRNAFAHSLAVTDFNTQKIENLTRNLKLVEQCTFDYGTTPERGAGFLQIAIDQRTLKLNMPRQRYIMTAQVMIALLSAPAGRMPNPRF